MAVLKEKERKLRAAILDSELFLIEGKLFKVSVEPYQALVTDYAGLLAHLKVSEKVKAKFQFLQDRTRVTVRAR